MDFDLLSTEICCFFERISGQRFFVLTHMNGHLMLELFMLNWLVVSTQLKHISQNGNLPQIGVENNKHLKPPPSKPL